MSNYILRHKETGRYVAQPGSLGSYCVKLRYAQRFQTYEQAEANRCIESENIVNFHEAVARECGDA